MDSMTSLGQRIRFAQPEARSSAESNPKIIKNINQAQADQTHRIIFSDAQNQVQSMDLQDYVDFSEKFEKEHKPGSPAYLSLTLKDGSSLVLETQKLSRDYLLQVLETDALSLHSPIDTRLTETIVADATPILNKIRKASPPVKDRPQRPVDKARSLLTFVSQHMAQLDSNGDGWISAEDLQQALKSKLFTAEQKMMLSHLQAHIEDLEELSNDEWGDENDGITLKDLQELVAHADENQHLLTHLASKSTATTLAKERQQISSGAPRSEVLRARSILHFVQTQFQNLDQNKDGWLSEEDIRLALKNYSDPADKEILALLQAYLSDLEELSNDEWGDENDGITLRDLEAFVAAVEKNPQDPEFQGLVGQRMAFEVANFERLDADHNNVITLGELQAVDKDLDGVISQAEAQNKKIDTRDLPQINQRYAQMSKAGLSPNRMAFYGSSAGLISQRLLAFVTQNMATLDIDGDGFLSEQEINLAIRNPRIQNDEAVLLSVLKKYRSDLEELSNDEFGDENDGITLKDLQQLYQQAEVTKESEAQSLLNNIALDFDSGQKKLAQALPRLGANSTRPVFRTPGNPQNSVRLTPLFKQGTLGDCYFLSALAGVLHQNPAAVANMIAGPSADGKYTVTFPGATRSIVVSPPTDAEIILYGTSAGDGSWLTLLEKAYAEYSDSDVITGISGYEILNSGIPGTGVSLLTGHSNDLDLIMFTDKGEIARKTQEALNHGRIVTASTFLGEKSQNVSGLHVFTIVGYNAGPPETLRIRNPWGHGGEATGISNKDSAQPVVDPLTGKAFKDSNGLPISQNDDGTFTLTIEEFITLFFTVNYEQPA